jgi:hypothetical protein
MGLSTKDEFQQGKARGNSERARGPREDKESSKANEEDVSIGVESS